MTETEEKPDPLVTCILEAAAEGPIAPEAIARRFAEIRRRPKDPVDLWRKYLTPVKQQAIAMAKAGRLEVIRKGEKIDPERAKGLIRFRIPPAE